jgi:hypothetical protein
VACNAAARPANAAPPLEPGHQLLIDRFTASIWPAIAAYNLDHSQGGAASAAFTAILAPNMSEMDDLTVRDHAQDLGRATEYNRDAQITHYSDGLTRAAVDVTSVRGSAAVLKVCYAYTDYWYHVVADTRHARATSQVAAALFEANGTRLLQALSDDHVVSGCTVGPARAT